MADVLEAIKQRRAELGGGQTGNPTLDAIRARRAALQAEMAETAKAGQAEAAEDLRFGRITPEQAAMSGVTAPESVPDAPPAATPSPTSAPEIEIGAQEPSQGFLPGLWSSAIPEREDVDRVMDYIRQINVGLIPGSEEVTAAIGATPDWLFGGGDSSWGQHYDAQLGRERARHKKFSEEKPLTSMALQTAGGLASAIPTMGYGMGSAVGNSGLVRRGIENVANKIVGHRPGAFQASGINRIPFSQRVAGGAAAGGLYGGAFGFGHGEGGARNRALHGIGDMYTGASIGAATPVVGAAVRPALGYIAKRRAARKGDISTRAVDAVQRALQQGTDDVTGRVDEAVPGTLWADQYGTTRELLGDRLAKMGDDADDVRRFIKGRGDRATERTTKSLDDSFGGAPAEGPEAVGERLRTSTAAARKAAYDDAYSRPIDYSTENGIALEEALKKVRPRFVAKAAATLREQGRESNQFFARLDADGNIVALRRMPDVREVDAITRAMNDAAKIERGSVGPGRSTTAQGGVWETQSKAIRDRLKEAVPEYGKAIEVAAPPIVARNAMNLGIKAISTSMSRDKLQAEIAALKRSNPKLANMVDEYMSKGMRYQFQEVVDRAKDPLARNPTLSGAVAVGSTRDPTTTRTIKDLSSKLNRDKVAIVIGDEKADKLFRTIDESAAATGTREAVEENIRKRRVTSEQDEREAGVLENLFNLRPGSAVSKAIQKRRDRRERSGSETNAVINALAKPADRDAMTAVMNVRKPSERGLVGAKRAEMGVGGTALAGIPAGEDWNRENDDRLALAKVLARRALGPIGAFMP